MDFGVSWRNSGTTGKFKFSKTKGRNLVMNKEKIVARRYAGFSNGVCFRYSLDYGIMCCCRDALLPWQLFLIEIVDSQHGWSGHMRIGLTQHNPQRMKPGDVPEMIQPGFVDDGSRTWAVALTRYHNRVENESKEITTVENNNMIKFANQRICVDNLYFRGQRKLTFNCLGMRIPDLGQATLDGSRIGVRIIPLDGNGEEISDSETKSYSNKLYFSHCNMHMIINGEDQGPSMKNIPLHKPLYVAMDVYSITTGIQIIQLNAMTSLKDLVREEIISKVKEPGVLQTLPLPETVINYCLRV